MEKNEGRDDTLTLGRGGQKRVKSLIQIMEQHER
jgi:hypothetical protein